MSIDVNVQNDLVIVTESSEDIVVNVSNAAGPAGANGVGVPVGGATGQVLKKFTNTDFDTYWAADASGLTSVGLSMPTAFTVSNTPLTTNGTIAVTGAGTAAQYVRGDGQLATFPSTASGGSSVNYYLNGSVNASVAGYKQLANTATIGGGTDFTLVGNGLIAQFLTDSGNPNRVEIPGGAWNFEMFFQVSSSGGNQKFYVELLKYNGTTFTSIASSSAVPEEITGGTSIDLYLTSLAVPTTALLVTDRLAIRVYIVDNSGGRTVTLHTEDNTLCEIITTFSGGISALNGLTANTQYLATGTSGTDFNISSVTDTHTFNLPTASATNRGALSSADWSTFSGKVSGSGVTGQVAYWNGTNSQTGSNNLFWDAANSRLGIGTNAPPVASLYINNSANNIQQHLVLKNTNSGSSAQVHLDLHNNAVNSTFDSGASLFFCSTTYVSPYASALGFWNYQNGPIALATNNQERLRVTSGGNLSIGNTTDSGQRLQVYGDAFIKGSGATSATNALLVQNSAGTEIFTVRNDGVVRMQSISSISVGGTIQFNNTVGLTNIEGNPNITNGSRLTFLSGGPQSNFIRININTAYQSSTGLTTGRAIVDAVTINLTGGTGDYTSFYANPTITSLNATSTYKAFEWSNNSGWGLYGAGTSANYLGGKLAIGTTTTSTGVLSIGANLTGGTTQRIAYLQTTIQSDVTGTAYGIQSAIGTAGITFTLSDLFHYQSSQASFGGGSVVTNQYGFAVSSNLIGATNNYGFYGNIPNGTNRWNLYMNGTADNYLAGKLLINTTTVGTFNLDVNGTARVSGATTITGALSVFSRIDILGDGANGVIVMQNLANTLCLRKFVKVLGDDGGYGNNNASAAFQIDGTNRGFLPPRMTTTQKNAIGTPAAGLVVYDTDTNKLCCYNGTTWNDLF